MEESKRAEVDTKVLAKTQQITKFITSQPHVFKPNTNAAGDASVKSSTEPTSASTVARDVADNLAATQ